MNQIKGEGTSKLDRAERLALALVLFLVLAQLMGPPMVGVANNGDFERLMKWGGLVYVTPSYEEKYFGWINREFRFEQSPWRAWKGFRSSEALFVKAAAIVGEVVVPGDRFDLRLLGLVHLLGFVAALGLLFRGWKAAMGRSALALVPGIGLLFCDIGYTAYFNSFYSEPAALIFLLAMMGAGLWLAADPQWDRLLLFCLCAGLFVAAKAQHVAFVPVLLLLCARLYWLTAEMRGRQVLVAFALALTASPFLLHVFTPWYADSARYHGVFYGVLKGSATPEQDLIALGLDPKFAVLANTTAFDPHLPVDIQSPAFREAFFDRINPIRVPWFYLTHPDRGLEKLRVSAANAFTLRPPYAGNFEKATGAPARAQTARWNAWSAFKQTCWPRSPWVLIGYWVLLLGGILWGYRRAAPRSKRLREWLLAGWGMMIAAFATPILGDGESDLARHLFVFNAFFDLSLLLLTGGLIGLIGRLRPLIRCTPLPMSS